MQFNHATIDSAEAVLPTLSTARKTLVFNVGSKSPLQSEMQLLLASLRITSRLTLNKKEILKKKSSKKLRIYLDSIQSTFNKGFMVKLLLKQKLSNHNHQLEGVEADEQLE